MISESLSDALICWARVQDARNALAIALSDLGDATSVLLPQDYTEFKRATEGEGNQGSTRCS